MNGGRVNEVVVRTEDKGESLINFPAASSFRHTNDLKVTPSPALHIKSSLNSNTAIAQPCECRLPPLQVRVDEDEEEQYMEERRASMEERRESDAAHSRSSSMRKLTVADHVEVDVKMQTIDHRVLSGRRDTDNTDRAFGASSAVAMPKRRTKSRLVETSFPCSPGSANSGRGALSGRSNGTSVRLEGAELSFPPSPMRASVRKLADEDDPFKGVDVQGRFRQGNLKPITVAQWVAFVVLMACVVCSRTVKPLKEQQLWGLGLWKWFLLLLVVLCGRLISGWLIRILIKVFEKNILLRTKVLYFVYGLRKGVQNCLWLGLALLAWKLMFDLHVQAETKYYKTLCFITRSLECFLIAAFIWLGKLLLVKSLASSFHANTFFVRIQETLYQQQLLRDLSGSPLQPDDQPTTDSLPQEMTGKKVDSSEAKRIEHVQKMHAQDVSAGAMKYLVDLVKYPGITTVVTTNDDTLEEISSQQVEAEAAAERIFENVAQKSAKCIQKKDLLKFLAEEKVEKLFHDYFEGSKETGKITKKAWRNWVVNVYHEMKVLFHSLNDTKTAVKELHRMASVVVVIIIIVVWLLVLGIATTHVLVIISSQLLLIGFLFNNTARQIFEAIIFLFIMHPFDVGDRCVIDGIHMVVEEMKILTTVFLKADDNEIVFYPNSVLATKPISNLYRSPNMWDLLNFSVHISTPPEKITMLEKKIAVYVKSKNDHWHPKFSVLVKELEDLNRMQVSVNMQHTINFQNMPERLSRRSELLLEIKRIFAELGIEYRLLTQPVQVSYGEPTHAVAANYPPHIVPYQGQLL